MTSTSENNTSSLGYGTRLPSAFHVGFNPSISSSNSSSVAPQPHTTPIAHFSSSECSHPSGSLISTNESYIVYAVKNGLIRVIDRQHALRTLLRGHNNPVEKKKKASSKSGEQTVTDISFFSGTSDVLATVGKLPSTAKPNEGVVAASGVLIWRLFNTVDGNSGEKQISHQKLLEIRFHSNNGSNDGAVKRIIWHPFNTNQFLLLHGNVATLVESTKLFTTKEDADGSHHVCNIGGSAIEDSTTSATERQQRATQGQLQLRGHTGSILDMCWNKRDARYVMTSSEDGTVRLWDLRTVEHGNEEGGLPPSAKCIRQLNPHEGRPVSRCLFLPPPNLPHNTSEGELTGPFVTAVNDNAQVAIWSAFGNQPSHTPVQQSAFSFAFEENNPVRFSLALCIPGNMAGAPPFLLFAGKTEKSLLALHLCPKNAAYGFDYITPFTIKDCILSWSVSSAPVSTYEDDVDAATNTAKPDANNANGTADSGGGTAGITTQTDTHEMCCHCVQSKAVQSLRVKPRMCLPPSTSGDESAEALPPGVVILMQEPAVVSKGELKDVTNDIQEKTHQDEEEEAEEEEEEWEEDEEGEGYLDEDASGECTDEEADNDADINPQKVTPPPAACLPPPGLDPRPVASSSAEAGGPFANWLGAIAASSTADVPSASKPNDDSTNSLPAAALSSITDISPPITKNTTKAPPGMGAWCAPPGMSAPPGLAAPPGMDRPKPGAGGPFLSPVEFLASSKPTPVAAKPAPERANTAPSDSSAPIDQTNSSRAGRASSSTRSRQNRRSKTPTRSKSPTVKTSSPRPRTPSKNTPPVTSNTPNTSSKPTKNYAAAVNTASSQKKAPAQPFPIKILKREDAAQPSSSQPVPLPVTSSATVPPPTSSSVSKPATVDMVALEEAMQRIFSAHAKKQESIISSQVQKTIKQEVQTNLIPVITKVVAQTMDQTVAKPLQISLVKAIKETTEECTLDLVETTSQSLREPVVNAFQKTMRDVMIPAYEATTQQMFQQIAKAVDTNLAAQQPAKDESLQQIQSMAHSIETMAKSIESLNKEVSQLRTLVMNQSNHARLVAGAGIHPSGAAAAPPPPPIDRFQLLKQEISHLASISDYEAAFTKALSASNADIAVYCCETADLSTVLQKETPALSQPVLLCLMQQLGSVLISPSSSRDNVRMVLAWLQEIAVTLDPTEERIHHHVNEVIVNLQANINAKFAEGDAGLRRPLQMLLQVIRGMGVR